MNFLILFLSPLFLYAGTIEYIDSCHNAGEEKQVSDPQPLFDHPRLEEDFAYKEILYFQEQRKIQKTVDKKNSSYMDVSYGYSDLTLSSIKPFYYPVNTTETVSTTQTQADGSTTQSSAKMTINESFAINGYGASSLSFEQQSESASQQYFLQFNAMTREKHLGVGLEISYNNNPIITLQNPSYQINRTITSTQTNTTATAGGTGSAGTSTYPAPSTISSLEVPVTLNNLRLKVVNVPIHFSMTYFPIYDGYFQPFVKAGIGINMSHTNMQVTEDEDPAMRGTLTPLYQTGWAFMPFTYTYGAGFQLMLTESLAFTCSYLKQKIDGRSTRFSVMVNMPQSDNSDSTNGSSTTNLNGTYGDMRFEFFQKTTLKEIGFAYYF